MAKKITDQKHRRLQHTELDSLSSIEVLVEDRLVLSKLRELQKRPKVYKIKDFLK